MWVPPGAEGRPGAIRVELRGERNGERATVIYGSLDRAGVAASATAAVVALRLARGTTPTGASGVAKLSDPLEMLTELSRRGVRSATFEGVG